MQAASILTAAASLAFPQITCRQLQTWIELRATETDLAVIKAVRHHCRQLKTA